MVSVASGGTADRIAARILFKVLRAGSGTRARYSSTFFGAPLPFTAELRLPDFTIFIRADLQAGGSALFRAKRNFAAAFRPSNPSRKSNFGGSRPPSFCLLLAAYSLLTNGYCPLSR